MSDISRPEAEPGKPVIEGPPAPKRRALIFLLKGALSMALIVLVARQLDFGALVRQLRSVDLGLLVLSAGLVLLQTVAGALRWHAILGAQGENRLQ